MIEEIIGLLVISIVVYLAGILRLCMFSTFKFIEATVIIIPTDIGIIATLIIGKLVGLDDTVLFILALGVAIVSVVLGEIFYKYKVKKENS